MAAKFVVDGDQYRKIDKRMCEIKRQLNQPEGSSLDPEVVAVALQRIVEGGDESVVAIPESISGHPYRSGAGESCETITVPDLSGPELIAEATEQLVLTNLDPDYAKYVFLRDERGQTYKVMIWKPVRRAWPAKDVRPYFKGHGFYGNSAAFIVWVTKHNPDGYYATIPENERLFRPTYGALCAPCFIRAGGGRRLGLCNGVSTPWDDRWAFVAFREIHS